MWRKVTKLSPKIPLVAIPGGRRAAAAAAVVENASALDYPLFKRIAENKFLPFPTYIRTYDAVLGGGRGGDAVLLRHAHCPV